MATGDIANRWKELSGEDNWKNILDPLDIDLRRYVIHYGEMAQSTLDAFNSDSYSKFAGDCRYPMETFFDKVGLTMCNPFKYQITKYLYATSKIPIPDCFIIKSLSKDAWDKESNWMGFVAVATDEGKAALGRRDILIAWRATVQPLELIEDFDFPLVSGADIFGKHSKALVLEEVEALVNKYKDEEISITVTGHSLGGALATVNAADIVANCKNNAPDNPCPVTAFTYGCPRVGDINFKETFDSLQNLHLLRVRNAPDLVPIYPLVLYQDVGEELDIDTLKSEHLRLHSVFLVCHNLEVYLHGVAGVQGPKIGFRLEVERDLALVNKWTSALKFEYLIPADWWCLRHKGMVQQSDGSWQLEGREQHE
ncbi:Phospholipase A1-IIgamma [Linum grandiflorum]